MTARISTVPEWVSVRMASEIAGVHLNTARAWIKQGRVRHRLIDGKHGPTYQLALEDLPVAPASSDTGTALLTRLHLLEDARLDEARGRAAAEAALHELIRVRDQLREEHRGLEGR